MPFSPCKHHITFVSGQVVPSCWRLPCQIGREGHDSRQRPHSQWAAVTARPLGQQGCMAGKDAIDKGRGRIARLKAIPGEQAVRELLSVERDFF